MIPRRRASALGTSARTEPGPHQVVVRLRGVLLAVRGHRQVGTDHVVAERPVEPDAAQQHAELVQVVLDGLTYAYNNVGVRKKLTEASGAVTTWTRSVPIAPADPPTSTWAGPRWSMR